MNKAQFAALFAGIVTVVLLTFRAPSEWYYPVNWVDRFEIGICILTLVAFYAFRSRKS